MGELYAESGVKRKETPKSIAIRCGLILLVIIALLASSLSPVLYILPMVVIIGLFFIFPRLKVEYEYVFCDGQIDFDKIMGQSKRKTVLKIDMEQVEIAAPLNSHGLDSYRNLPKKDFTSLDKECKPFAVVGRPIGKESSQTVMILFEPSEKMIDCMKQKSPRKVVTY